MDLSPSVIPKVRLPHDLAHHVRQPIHTQELTREVTEVVLAEALETVTADLEHAGAVPGSVVMRRTPPLALLDYPPTSQETVSA